MGIVDLFFWANKEKNVIKFVNNFSKKLKELETINQKLRIELINHPRSKNVFRNKN